MNRPKVNQKTTELCPLHKKLISSFPFIRKEVIEKLAQKVGKQTSEVKKMVSNLLLLTSENYDINNVEINKLIKDTINLIRELSTKTNLFYIDLPKGWEKYLKNSVNEILCSMKNKDYLTKLFDIVIEKIKSGEKIKFLEILNTLTSNKSSKYELSKILSELKEKYNIDFILIGGSGSVVKIGDFTIKTDIKDNLEEIEKSFERIKDRNGVLINIIGENFLSFIKEVILNRNLGEFQQHEFIMYCLEKNPNVNIGLIRTFTKEIFQKLAEQGILIKSKYKNSYNYEITFNKPLNNYYNTLYFSNIEKNSEFLEKFNNYFEKLLKTTTSKNKELIILFRKELIELNQKGDFFILKAFLEKYSFNNNKVVRLNVILNELIKSGILGRKGRERYYLINNNSKELSSLKNYLFLSNFKINGDCNNLNRKILLYFFNDLSLLINLDDLKNEDLEIYIEENEIKLIFKNEKFAKYENNIIFICDEICERKSINIRPIFKNN